MGFCRTIRRSSPTIITGASRARGAAAVLLLLAGGWMQALAQEPGADYRVVLTAGAGYSRLISSMAADGLSKNGLTGTVRLMWAPEHLLSVGVEGGYQTLYVLENQTAGPDYGTSRVRVVQTSVPLHLAFAMRVTDALAVLLGIGGEFVTTHIDAFGSRNRGTQWSTSNMGGVALGWPLGRDVRLGAEARYYAIHKMKNGDLILQAVLAVDILRY